MHKSSTIRRIAVMIDLDWALAHHHEVYAGIHRYARQRGGWECILNPFVEVGLPGSPELDGVVGRISARTASQLTKAGIPAVNVWRNSPAKGLPGVFLDATSGGRMAGTHLKSRGFRHFGFIGLTADKNTLTHLEGLREGLGEYSDRLSTCWVNGRYARSASDWKRFREKIFRWIRSFSLPIGVFAMNDMLCRHLAEACLQERLEVPHQVALVGAGNNPVVCGDPKPALSSIDYGFEEIGFKAAALLDDLIDGKPAPTEPIYLLPNGLVPRQSSDSFSVDDPVVTRALRYMTDNAHLDIDVDGIADQVLISRRTLSRSFQKHLGKSVHEMLTHLRLERAKRSMIQPGAVLKTVAKECGFRDAVHLYKVFQSVEGTTPSEYRERRAMHQGDNNVPEIGEA